MTKYNSENIDKGENLESTVNSIQIFELIGNLQV